MWKTNNFIIQFPTLAINVMCCYTCSENVLIFIFTIQQSTRQFTWLSLELCTGNTCAGTSSDIYPAFILMSDIHFSVVSRARTYTVHWVIRKGLGTGWEAVSPWKEFNICIYFIISLFHYFIIYFKETLWRSKRSSPP